VVNPCVSTASHVVPIEGPAPALWSREPGRRMKLSYERLGIDPDGSDRFLVRATFFNGSGQETKLASGGDVEFTSSSGTAQWQTRSRFGGPAAIIRTKHFGDFWVRVAVHASSRIEDGRIRIANTTPAEAVAKPLGPYAVQIGWNPQAQGSVEVDRSGPDGSRTVCSPSPPSSTCRDVGVQPNSAYTYTVKRAGAQSVQIALSTPQKTMEQTIDSFRGKGMWLRFSPDDSDRDAYSAIDVDAVVRQAKRAGLRYIELRMSYGEFWELAPPAKPRIDALIDACSRAGIGVFAWAVPRAATFDDLSTTIAGASYRTPSGTPMAGVAIDLERGADYMGDGAAARNSIAAYVKTIREALGPSAVIVATVEDPYSGKLTDRDIPISDLARTASAIQPMAYWRMFEAGIGATQTAYVVENSIRRLREAAGHRIPINFGGQTLGLGECGAPPPDEIRASLERSRRLGAIGETFFDWNGTYKDQWDAIESFHW
jgi:hypothetical protein